MNNIKSTISDLRKYRLLVAVIFIFCMMSTLSFLAVRSMQRSSAAASTDNFQPGNIISDSTMSNYTSMSREEIQIFLTAKGNCNNTNYNQYLQLKATYPDFDWHFENGHFVCLAEERFGDGIAYGSALNPGEGQSAADIIYEAAQDYRINPQVILVLLEKEQSLITDNYPNNRQFRSATGYGCPDTAACDSKYYGFKNQVRNAAAMFRSVLDGGWSNYPAGQMSYIQYNPSASCGGSMVYIENRATSALYRYTPYQPNLSALAAGYGTGDICSAYGNRNFYLLFTDWFGSTQQVVIDQTINEPATQNDLSFAYQTHVAEIGWQEAKAGGTASGTVGQQLQLEAFQLDLGQNNGSIVYRAHVAEIGWESTWHQGGETAGTTGQSKTIEAIQLQLIDDLADQYDIYYRVHAAEIGWMDWAKNGAPAGTTNQSRRLEAIQVAIVKKGANISLPAGASSAAFNGTDVARYLALSYQVHAAEIGWMDWVASGNTAGTTGQSRRLEALNLQLIGDDSNNFTYSDIQYRTYARGLGWTNWVASNQVSGTTGESRPLEAIEINLPDNLTSHYTIRYRAHVSDIGWMDWVENGATSGTINQNHQVEALEVQLIRK